MMFTHPTFRRAEVAELADARDSKSRSLGSVGSTPTFGIILVVSSGGEVRIGSNARLTHGFTSTRTASPSSFSSIRVKMRCKLRFWASGVIWPSIPPRSPSIRIARSTSTGWASSASAARNSALNSANLRS